MKTPINEWAAELVARPRFGDIAREEFWIVAKSFFAPVYGTLIVLKHLLRFTRQVDRRALAVNRFAEDGDAELLPAE
jgi:hypothetical protein